MMEIPDYRLDAEIFFTSKDMIKHEIRDVFQIKGSIWLTELVPTKGMVGAVE